MRNMPRLTPCAALVAGGLIWTVSLSALAQSDAARVNKNGLTCFNGYAYALKSGDYRYTEHHELRRVNGRITTWNVTYVGTNGQVLANKHMDFSANPTVPVYRMTMPKSGYEEGIKHSHGQWTMFRRKSSQAATQTQRFSIAKPMAADSGFNPLVKEYFADLQSGKTVAFKFVAAGRQSVIDLKANKIGTSTFRGRPAVDFKFKLDMFLVGRFVQSLKLSYDPKTKRLLEYRGIGNIRNEQGEVYPVKVIYPNRMPEVASSHGAPAPHCGTAKGS